MLKDITAHKIIISKVTKLDPDTYWTSKTVTVLTHLRKYWALFITDTLYFNNRNHEFNSQFQFRTLRVKEKDFARK